MFLYMFVDYLFKMKFYVRITIIIMTILTSFAFYFMSRTSIKVPMSLFATCEHIYTTINQVNGKQGNCVDGKIRMYNESLERFLHKLDTTLDFGFDLSIIRKMTFNELVTELDKQRRSNHSRYLFDDQIRRRLSSEATNYDGFLKNISLAGLYATDDQKITGLLQDMASERFKIFSIFDVGSDLKFQVTYTNGMKALLKPMRHGRDVETNPDHYYFDDFERHNAEIGAFHLDRLLGFYRVPPVTGRLINITKEILPLAEPNWKQTIYKSPAGNTCFYGKCRSGYCLSRYAFCGRGDMIEFSVMAWIQEGYRTSRKHLSNPYRRSYSTTEKAEWEKDDNYCQKIRKNSDYPKAYIINLIDLHIFDFLTGNMDRHDTDIFEQLQEESFIVHTDNARGFGKSKEDELSILAPLRQCCKIRKSTLLKFIKLYIGSERLSELLGESLKLDPLYPVLNDGHLAALDRRVMHVLAVVKVCIDRNSVKEVVIDDGY